MSGAFYFIYIHTCSFIPKSGTQKVGHSYILIPLFQPPSSFPTYIKGVPLCVIIRFQILISFLRGCARDATSYKILWKIRPIFRLDGLLKKSGAALLCLINVIPNIRVPWKIQIIKVLFLPYNIIFLDLNMIFLFSISSYWWPIRPR